MLLRLLLFLLLCGQRMVSVDRSMNWVCQGKKSLHVLANQSHQQQNLFVLYHLIYKLTK